MAGQRNTIERNLWSAALAADVTDAASHAVQAAPGAGQTLKITTLVVTNLSGTVGTRVDILSGATVIWTGFAGAGGGGYSCSWHPDVPLVCAAAAALNVQCGTTGAQVRVSAAGYIG